MTVAYEPKYTKVTGDLASGVLLSQLCYWFTPTKTGKSKLSIEREGKEWLAKSRVDMMAETGLTIAQLRTALNRLKDLGLIEVEIHLFNNKTTPHYHLHLSRLSVLLDEEVSHPVVRNSHNRLSQNITSGRENSTQPIEAEITSETTAEIVALRATGSDGFKKEVERQINNDSISSMSIPKRDVDNVYVNVIPLITGEKVSTIKEILAHRKQLQSGVPAGNGPRALALCWKKGVSAKYGGFSKELTSQEVGQIKQFATKVGDRAKDVLVWVIEHWSEYSFECKARYGLTVAPERPVVGWLLKYHDVAVALSTQKENPTLQSSAKVIPSKATSVPIPVTTPTQPNKISQEKLAAALAKIQGTSG